MDVLVCIKRVPMVGSALILKDDGSELDTSRLGFQLSPHEENAVEAAVQLIEQHGGTVTLLTLGTAEAEEQLREQLAIGADRAEIAGVEPSVSGEGVTGCLLVLVVTGKNVIAAYQYLFVVDLHLYIWQRGADRARLLALHGVDAEHR